MCPDENYGYCLYAQGRNSCASSAQTTLSLVRIDRDRVVEILGRGSGSHPFATETSSKGFQPEPSYAHRGPATEWLQKINRNRDLFCDTEKIGAETSPFLLKEGTFGGERDHTRLSGWKE
ncbi:hypothetical protein Desti_0212 [Desulfomonile tiedjei DSM 6799]|uniref:Uncharacterized protein n=1 Tax=Desulfomonile tiedjei (strain ATCC 49306 / DSM 6799 / DCB-1) TaxID=706587 RepID=I4C067_DESTA|nr:hypothetical protein Desti_0212 [Desulfomonile tiedjei DSM 6799]